MNDKDRLDHVKAIRPGIEIGAKNGLWSDRVTAEMVWADVRVLRLCRGSEEDTDVFAVARILGAAMREEE